ncbi:MAG: CDP-alcohol phosphatidyltransferase family protein [Thermoplasmata archaeon]|nr:CDP-alcohol phosphatidyltransferase family protein [Thermoplasmata archaeon]
MVLDNYRSTGDKYLMPWAERFKGLDPNTITWIALAFAFGAGVCLALSDRVSIPAIFIEDKKVYFLLVMASTFIFINGFFDAIDGKVSRLTKRVTKRGDFLDHATDRYADLFILGGMMLSVYCNVLIGALAIIAVMLTSYMGTQAQAMGVGRDYSGILGRADRLVILIFAPVVQFSVMYFYEDGRLPFLFELSVIEIVMIWFIVAGNLTAIHRGLRSWKELK